MKLFAIVAILAYCAHAIHVGKSRQGQKVTAFQPFHFDNHLDHFNASETRTWKQLYYKNDTAYVEGGPIFLFLGGEAALDFFFTELPQYAETARLAALNQGAFFAIEHRFYGNKPYGLDWATDNLKWLSVEQALADAVEFRDAMAQHYPNSKWIVTGVSYSGGLSAFARVAFPDKFWVCFCSSSSLKKKATQGCYASSGVVAAIEDLYEYEEVSMSDVSVDCRQKIRWSLEEVERMLMEDMDGVNTLFFPCEKLTHGDEYLINRFLYDLGQNVIGPAQEAQEEQVCKFFDHVKNGKEGVIAYADFMRSGLKKDECYPIFNPKDVAMADPPTEGQREGRAWWWQKCTQYGYFKNHAKPTVTVQSLRITTELHLEYCKAIFGKALRPDCRKINESYGAKNNNATRVVYTNGGADPWHSCGILTSDPSRNTVAIVNKGAGHGAETVPASSQDLPSVVECRKELERIVKKWLE